MDVSVIVPCTSAAAASRLADRLSRLAVCVGGELIAADASGELRVDSAYRVVPALAECSTAHARNAGAAAARGEWLLFVDPDVMVDGSPDPVGADVVWDRTGLLVRRTVWAALGGFLEGIRGGELPDFVRRAEQSGWTIGASTPPVATPSHRSLGATFRHGRDAAAATQWLRRRWPGQPDPGSSPPSRPLARVAFAAGKLVGPWFDNRAARHPEQRASTRVPVQMWCDRFPVVSETFVVSEIRELRALGHAVDVRALARPLHPALGVDDIRARYLEDDTRLERLAAVVRVALRNPRRVLRDRRDKPRWAAQEPVHGLRSLAPAIVATGPSTHLHAHFASQAALCAMRATRIGGQTWSVTAHAYDIYQGPTNLAEKLRAATFVTSGCEYTVNDLKAIAGPDYAERVHEIVMGVDPDRFRRRRPHSDRRSVIAIGRLVPKKGFADLVRAAADPRLAAVLDDLLIVGDGPLLGELRELAAGLQKVVIAGRMEPDDVLAALERAAVLAMPCVVAADGDRDSMPVVVKEAAAMEIPVVVTDEVGLPELVRPTFGRIVPPGDPGALATALVELLELPLERRIAMGRAGREHVSRAANVAIETAKLSELIERAA